MASWSDIEPEGSPARPMSRETETAQKRQPFSLELSAREDEFKLVHLKRCFNRCDRDDDGFIDSKDLRKLCVMLDLPQFASGESANALFRALDVNSQGKIAFLDFLRYKDIYLKSALTAGEMSGDTPKQVGSLSPASETASSYQEAVMSVDSDPEGGHMTFESPGETGRLYQSDLRGQQSEPLGESETGGKAEKRRVRPNSAGLANGSSRKSSRPSSADLKHLDFTNSNPSLSLRAKSYTYLSASSAKEETARGVSRKRSASSGYIHQLLSSHQQPGISSDVTGGTESEEDSFDTSTPIPPVQTKPRRKLTSADTPIFNPSLASNSLPLEALPSAPVCVLQTLCQDGSDHISITELMELLQALGFDQIDVFKDVDTVLQEVPRDGEGRMSVIGVALAMERILVGEEEVPEGSLLRQISLKLYQQEINIWRRTHQISMAEKNQLLENIDYHRGEQRRLINWGDDQAELEALHWDRKLRELEQKHRLKLRSVEDSKRYELESLMEKTTKELEDSERSIGSLQSETDQLRELIKDLKTDNKYMKRQLDEYRTKLNHSERFIEALQLQLQDQGLSQLTDVSLDSEIGRTELDRVIDEKNQLIESHKNLQDNYDELQADNQKIQQQIRTLQNRYKQSVKAMAARPVGVPKVRPSLPRNRHSISLIEPPEITTGASPEPSRKESLMVEMIDHDFQAMEKQRVFQLEEHCTDLELRLEALEDEKKSTESKLSEAELDRDRERQKRRKEEKLTNSKLSELEADCLQLNVLKTDAEERLGETQTNLSNKTAELNEVQKVLSALTRKVTDLEQQCKSLSSHNSDLLQAGQENELRETNLLNERGQLKKQLQTLQTELSSCKSKHDTNTFELERLRSESEQQVTGLKLDRENSLKRVQQELIGANQLMAEMKHEHSQAARDLENRIEELERSLAEASERHRAEVCSMSEELRKAAERDKTSLELNQNTNQQLKERVAQLDDANRNRDLAEKAKIFLNESLERCKSERDQLEKQLRGEVASLQEKLQAAYSDTSLKLEQSDSSHQLLLGRVRGEYETQIARLHEQLREHTRTAESTESKSREEISALTSQVDAYKNKLGEAELMLTHKQQESIASEEEKRVEMEQVLSQLESCRAERDMNSESYFEQINALKEKLSCVEEQLNEVTLQGELERGGLEENIQDYEERENVLIEEYEQRLIELQTKFEKGMADRSLEDERMVEEMEMLSHQLMESRGENELMRDEHQLEIQRLKQEELASVYSLNDFKKSKEIEITRLRNSVIEYESKIRSLEKATLADTEVLSKKSQALDSVMNELEFSHNARKHLEKQLIAFKTELNAARQEKLDTLGKLERNVREFENDMRHAGVDKQRCLSEAESRHSAQAKELRRGIETRQTDINMLKLRLLEADSVKAGDELYTEWKSHIQDLTLQIQELERQIKSRDSIIEHIRKESKEVSELRLRLNRALEEKEALFSIIEDISLVGYTD